MSSMQFKAKAAMLFKCVGSLMLNQFDSVRIHVKEFATFVISGIKVYTDEVPMS